MTCEDTPTRLTWTVELYEPCSHVWMCRGYGRATTTADPGDIARAVLAGYLAGNPARGGETFRAITRTDTGAEAVVTAAELADGEWEAGPDVRQALPLYLREALTGAG
jgi:hypothetical protein